MYICIYIYTYIYILIYNIHIDPGFLPKIPSGFPLKAWTSTETAKFQELCARFDEAPLRDGGKMAGISMGYSRDGYGWDLLEI